ncbi:hypothetical protein RRG08_020822 [Elysia crispata]|uniref:HTH psq-type domain-containing protein n=1 Tax=Elysia crispata TaxID=231223 RepID=A0AAE0XV59_9GAST|nr:hypothetical protein RRG08_020822 [Elysia crispata]
MASTAKDVRKRKCISHEQKVAIIEEVERKAKLQSKICKEQGIALGSLYTILKHKDKILSVYRQGLFSQDRKKMRRSDTDDVDRALYTWFKGARVKHVPLAGPIIVVKVKDFAERLHWKYRMVGPL